MLGTTVLSTLGASNAGSLGPILKVLVLVASIAVNAAAFIFAFRVAAARDLSARDLSARDVAPGAIAAASIWQLLQTFGVVYVGHVIKGTSVTSGVLALVLGLLAFLYITATAVVPCAEANVVRVDHLHPRSLLTPFIDDVDLTSGDRRGYTSRARAQRSKVSNMSTSTTTHQTSQPSDHRQTKSDLRGSRPRLTDP